jgi:hypothetical protein
MKNISSWDEFLFDSSKQLIELGVNIIEQDPKLFPQLFNLALSQKAKYSQRAARVVYYYFEKNPQDYSVYLIKILERLPYISNESLKFSLLRVFTICKLPKDDEFLGLLTKICIDSLEAKVKRIAIKVYAIDILYRISQIIPEFKNELLYQIEKYKDSSSMAYLCRAQRISENLIKEIKSAN